MTNYVINRTDPANGSFTVPAGEINGTVYPWNPAFYLNSASGQVATSSSSSLVFGGQGIVEYGELIQNNLMFLMEHFAFQTRPLLPTQGQIWYKNANYTDPSFPSDPTLAGLYVWDGVNWGPILSAVGGIVNMSGARITNLGNAIAATDALNRQTGDGRYLQLTGGTLTGPVTFSSGAVNVTAGSVTFSASVPVTITDTPTLSLHAANKSYVDAREAVVTGLVSAEAGARIAADGILAGDIATINGQLPGFIVSSGDTMTGVLSFDPNASIFALTGGTGSFSFGLKRLQQVADPSANTDAATKFYVDDEISTAIAGLPPAAVSDGVVFAGLFTPGTGVLTLQRTLGLPDVVVSGLISPLVHTHVSSQVTYDLSSIYSESTLIFTQTATPGFPVIPVYNAIQQLDKVVTRLTRPIERRIFTGDNTTITFNLGSLLNYTVEENRLQVYLNGVKQYANQRGSSVISFTASSINSGSSTGLSGVQSFGINVNGAGVTTVVITATPPFTYDSLVAALIAQFTTLTLPATAVLVQRFNRMDLHIFSTTTGTGSSVVVTYGPGELFTNIAVSSAPVNTAITQNLGYAEVGIPGDPSSTFTFTTAPVTGAIIEALVIPGL